tara:strand:- start:1899 stop:2405 length:507 start_codon:yes stop_codon:yes gene_type:complete
MSEAVGQVLTTFTNLLVRSVERDGQYANSRGNTIGSPELARVLCSPAEELQGKGKEMLRSLNVFENECIVGFRVDPIAVFAAFEEEHGRWPQKGDRVSFQAKGNLCAPVAFSAGEGRYVIPTHENELDGINRDVILDYTNCEGFEWVAAAGEAVATVAADVDVTKLPW